MSFWKSEIGEVTGSAEDAFAKTFKQIPDGTMALAGINNFINVEHNGSKYLNIEWLLTDGEFKGQKVSQKIKAFDSDPKVRHRALNMLKLIYILFNVKPQSNNPPTDKELQVFHKKIAGIKIRETEPNEEGKQYNWVSEVHPSQGFVCETGIKLVVTHTPKTNSSNGDFFDSALSRNPKAVANGAIDDDIPF